MALKPSIYEKKEGEVAAGFEGWYFSCCGKEQGPFDNEGLAEAAAALHAFGH